MGRDDSITSKHVYDDIVLGGSRSRASSQPSNAIAEVRKRIGESFREAEKEWMGKIKQESDSLKVTHPKRVAETDSKYVLRLEKLVLKQKPELVAEITGKVRLVGCVIGHPESTIVKEDIVPRIDYWHHRSGRHADFVCLGFSRNTGNNLDGKAFSQIVNLFEEEFNWRYSGETDLLVFNTRYDCLSREAIFDLSDVVALTLERAVEDKAIRSVSSLIEDIINVTEDYKGDNPAWVVSDKQGLRLSGSAIKQFLLSLLPAWAKDDANRAFHFYVKDLQKRA